MSGTGERPMVARARVELARRPSRAADHVTENRALIGLARDLGAAPRRILERMSEVALEVCRAHSAGFSLLTDDGKRFCWEGVAGVWARHVGGGTPRDFGPCGMVLDADEALLFWHPETKFAYLADTDPHIDEGLLLPFHVAGKAVGTLWVISHDASCRFDGEDLRVMSSLATFASAAYQAQRQSEHRFREILDALPAAVYTTDAQGRITHYNEAAVTVAGRVPQLGVDRWCVSWKLRRADGAPLPHDECPMAIALKEGRPIRGAEIVVERPDGTSVPAMPYPTPLRDASGTLVGAVNMIVDIADRKRIEDHLRAIVETTPECVKLVARDGTLLEMNAAGLAMVAAKRASDVIGKDVGRLIAPEDRAKFRAFHESVCDGRSGTLEFDVVDLDGKRRHMESHAVPMATQGHGVAHLALTRDVSERRKAEAALRDADRRKDEFIATLSHELRNPLAPIRSGLALLRSRTPLDDATGRIHDVMDRQLEHLVHLVDDLLELSRIATGAIELKPEVVDLRDVIRAAIEACEPASAEAGLRLELDLGSQRIPVDGDRVRLTQIVSNLLNNAVRFTGRGGRIAIGSAIADGRALVSIRDSGCGFDAARGERLFDMFSKGQHSSGLGIGLALSRRLARLHGGNIEASSEGEGRGADFRVWLPLAVGRDERPSVSASDPSMAEARFGRVLVVDDNQDAAEMLAALVETLGCEVRVAFDGERALELARTFRPHLTVMDIGMPEMDGYETARRMRAEHGPELRLVALTGWGQAEDRRRARDAGFDAHLVKPVDVDAVEALLVAPEASRATA